MPGNDEGGYENLHVSTNKSDIEIEKVNVLNILDSYLNPFKIQVPHESDRFRKK